MLTNLNTQEGKIIIKYLPSGVVHLPGGIFKCLTKEDQANTQLDTCGFDAYKHATGSNMTLTRFR